MRYDVYGPFSTPRFGREATRASLDEFWATVEAAEAGLSRAVGVHVFTSCFGDRFVPWYVGKTVARTGCHGEIFQEHKLNHYVSSPQRERGARRCISSPGSSSPGASSPAALVGMRGRGRSRRSQAGATPASQAAISSLSCSSSETSL